MWKALLVGLILMACSTVIRAQVSTDEAYQKLKDRQQHRGDTTQPAETEASLRAEVVELRARVAALEKQLSDANQKLAGNAAPPAPKQPAPAQGETDDHVEIGMTVDQVKAMSRGTMILVSEAAGGTQVYRAHVGPMKKSDMLGKPRLLWMAPEYLITFQDGKVVQFTRQ